MNKTIALTATLTALLGIAGLSDFDALQSDHDMHCEMVSIWEADAARGISPEDRSGWPNYDERTCP